MKFFVTVSSSHPSGSGHFVVNAENENEARKKTFEYMGDKWCFMYDDLDDVHPFDRKCHGVIEEV